MKRLFVLLALACACTAAGASSDLYDAGTWKADRACQVSVAKHKTVRWDLSVDKSAFGGLSIRSERLGQPLPEVISFQIKTPIPALNINLGDRDATYASYQFYGIPVGQWSWVELKTAEPWFLWSKGADGKLSDLDFIGLVIEPRWGEIENSGRYTIELRNFTLGPAPKQASAAEAKLQIPKLDLSAKMTEYKSLQAQAGKAVDSLGKLIDDARAKGFGVDYELVTYNVAKDAVQWSAMDADYAVAHSRPKFIRDAKWQMEWAISACARSEKALRERLASGDKRNIDRPVMQNLQMRNGDYYIGGRPVILTGIGSPWTNKLRDYGFNGYTVFEFAKGSEARGAAEEAAKVGLSIDLFAASHHFLNPAAYEKYPDLDPTGFERRRNGNLPMNVDSPGAKDLRGPTLDDITSAVVDHPAVAAYGLCNELWWADSPDYDPADFQSFLKTRYDGDLARLNKLWETGFAGFDSISYTPKTRAAREDMGRYTAFRISRWQKWECGRLNQGDPKRPGYVKVHGGWWSVGGIDVDSLGEAMSASSADCYPAYGKTRWTGAGRYYNDPRFAADFWTQAIITDTYRSLQPNKPIIDSEYHVIPYGEPFGVENAPEEYYSAMFWQGALHGRDAAYMWIGQRRGVHPWVDYESNDYLLLAEPWAMHAAGKTALDMERLGKYVVAFQHAKSDVALLRNGTDFPEWYKQLYFQDCQFDLITPTGVEQGNLGRYRVLVASGDACLSARGLQQLAAFLKSGGKLITGSGAFAWDEKDQPNDLSVLNSAKNSIIRPGGGDLGAALDRALVEANITRPIRSGAQHVELRTTAVDGHTVIYAINFDPKPQTLQLPGIKGTDLISGRAVSDSVKLGALETVMVRVD